MNNEEVIEETVRDILIEHFDISFADNFWSLPILQLSEKFRLISYLLELEHYLQLQFGDSIRLIEEIDVAVDTPKHLVLLIKTQIPKE